MFELNTSLSLNKVLCSFILIFTFLLPTDGYSQCYPDTSRPKARCRNVTVYLDTTGQAGVHPLQVDNGSYDNCNEWYLILKHPCYFCSDIGNQNITLWVQDRAGNTSSCTSILTVRDTSRPKLTLKSNLAVSIQPTVAKVTVTAQQVINSVSDNCTSASKMTYGLRKVGQGTGFPATSSLTFTCADTGKQVLEVWVRDSSGNVVSNTANIQVTDPNKVCTPVIIITPAIIGGIKTEIGKPIVAKVTLSGGSAPAPTIIKTSDYNFSNLQKGGTFTVTASRDTDWINGVTSFDIALITRHILEIAPFDSQYKVIAADSDRDGYVDATDILLLRRLILRQINVLPNNTSWRFIPKNVQLPAPPSAPPTNIPELLSYTNLQDTIRNADFVAIKIGDVNNTAQNFTSNTLQVRGAGLTLSLEDKHLEAHKTYTLDVKLADADAIAFQTTLNFDKTKLRLLNIEGLDLKDFNTSNFAIFNEEGKATLSWNGDNLKNNKNNTLLRLTIQTEKECQLSQSLYNSSDLTPSAAFGELGEAASVRWEYALASSDFALLPNAPNPFSSETTIRFRLPFASDAELTIFDETGRIVKNIKRSFTKGYNELPLQFDTPSVSGVYYYTLKTPTHSATERMVILR